MLSELQPILIAAAVFIPAVALAQFFDTRSIRRKLQAMLEALYRGNLHAPEDFHFLDTQPNQLYFPFTEAELRCIARAREVNRHELTVEITPSRFSGTITTSMSAAPLRASISSTRPSP